MPDTEFIYIKPSSQLPEISNLSPGWLLFYDDTDELKKMSTFDFYQSMTGSIKPISPYEPTPTLNGWYRPTEGSDLPGLTYSNAGNLTAINGYDTLFYLENSIWTKTSFKLSNMGDDYFYPYALRQTDYYADLVSTAVKEIFITDFDSQYDYQLNLIRKKFNIGGSYPPNRWDIKVTKVESGNNVEVERFTWTVYDHDDGNGLNLLPLMNSSNELAGYVLIDWNKIPEGFQWDKDPDLKYKLSKRIGDINANYQIKINLI